MLGDDKFKSPQLPIQEERETIDTTEDEVMMSNRQKRPKTREKVFLVNKRASTNVVNQRSCYSKQTILLSHGDQYREIYEFTKKINDSLRSTSPRAGQDQQKPPPKTAELGSDNGSERIYNNNLKLHLSPRLVQRYEGFKPREKPLETFE